MQRGGETESQRRTETTKKPNAFRFKEPEARKPRTQQGLNRATLLLTLGQPPHTHTHGTRRSGHAARGGKICTYAAVYYHRCPGRAAVMHSRPQPRRAGAQQERACRGEPAEALGARALCCAALATRQHCVAAPAHPTQAPPHQKVLLPLRDPKGLRNRGLRSALTLPQARLTPTPRAPACPRWSCGGRCRQRRGP